MKPEEIVCDICDGRGYIPANLEKNELAYVCPHCVGHGKLDWIENITGKKPPEPQEIFDGTSSIYVSHMSVHQAGQVKMGV